MFQRNESLLHDGPGTGRFASSAAMRVLFRLCTGFVLAFAASFPAHGFSSAPYFPLTSGFSWTYQENGFGSYTRTVQGPVIFNGAAVMSFYYSPENNYLYFTNDANGIRGHGAFFPNEFDPDCGAGETDALQPFRYATPDITLGQVINDNGTGTASIGPCSYPLTYTSQSNIVAFETVSVPFGTFVALKVIYNRTISYLSIPITTLSATYWLAQNVGVVKAAEMEDGFPYTYTLTGTNVIRTAPDAFSFPPQTGVPLNSTVDSNTIIVTGTTAAASISITGGEFSINGGAFTSAAGNVSNSQTVTVRQTSSASPTTTTDATLTIGGVSATFSATTVSVPAYTLSVQVSGTGSVTSNTGGINCGAVCSASYLSGTQVTLTAALTVAGTVFSGWSGGGCSGTGTCTVTMDAAKTVTATFVPNTLTIVKVGSGTVSGTQTSSPIAIDCGPTCSPNIREGGTVTLNASAAPGYTFTGWSGSGCSGTGTCVIVMNAPTTVTATFTFIDTVAPSVPGGLTATATGGSQIDLAWTASTDNVAVAQYQVFQGGVFRATVNAPATHFTDTGLAALTGHSYNVAACDAAGNCSEQSPPVSATTLAAGQFMFAPQLSPGFNLVGNALNVTIDVAATFGNQTVRVDGVTDYIVTIWKWNAAGGRWAFYSPKKTVTENAAFVMGKYDLLTTIDPGEGYWVNAVSEITLPAQTGSGFNWDPIGFSALSSDFHLIAHAEAVTPSQFNSLVSVIAPGEGVIPTDNFFTLWAWNAVLGKWYFYAPQKESTGGLDEVKSYALSRNFLHFQDYSKLIGIGTGFWVNRP